MHALRSQNVFTAHAVRGEGSRVFPPLGIALRALMTKFIKICPT